LLPLHRRQQQYKQQQQQQQREQAKSTIREKKTPNWQHFMTALQSECNKNKK